MPIHHISLNVTNLPESKDFYLAALKPLGYTLQMAFHDDTVLGFGDAHGCDFWMVSLDVPHVHGSDEQHPVQDKGDSSKKEGSAGKLRKETGPVHVAFKASSKEQVNEFHAAALAAGGKDNGKPGPRPAYGPNYYGAFVFDPEGRNIEVTFSG